VWGEFCAWYVELAKVRLYGDDPAQKARAQATLAAVFEGILKLLHPIMPFITEELWQTYGEGSLGPLAMQSYPQADEARSDPEAEAEFQAISDAVTTIRMVRADLGVPPAQAVEVSLFAGDAERKTLGGHEASLRSLAKASPVHLASPDAPRPARAASAVVGGIEAHLHIAALDLNVPEELMRLDQQIAKLDAEAARSEKKLANAEFTSKAPEAVIAKEQGKLAEAEEALAKLRARRELLKGLG